MLLPSEQESHQIFLNTSQQKVGVERKQSPAGMLLFEPFLCSFEILNINSFAFFFSPHPLCCSFATSICRAARADKPLFGQGLL